MKWKITDSYSCIHNYIDATTKTLALFHSPMLRKGAISAKHGESIIIPINMRGGIILGTGLGNINWNCSAPHGSGRLMKREDIKAHYTISSYKAATKQAITNLLPVERKES